MIRPTYQTDDPDYPNDDLRSAHEDLQLDSDIQLSPCHWSSNELSDKVTSAIHRPVRYCLSGPQIRDPIADVHGALDSRQ